MCRLLAFQSSSPRTFSSLLADQWESFVALSKQHSDGWGISWVDDAGQLHSMKEAGPAWQSDAFAYAVNEIPALAGILHFRWATPGLDVSEANTHPFVWEEEQVAFAHNGAIGPADKLALLLTRESLARVKGSTDSENYFWLWVQNYSVVQDPVTAATITVRMLKNENVELDYSSLNAMILQPDGLVVIADYQEDSPFNLDSPGYYDLYFRQAHDLTVVASSEWNIPNNWSRIKNHTLVALTSGGLKMISLV